MDDGADSDEYVEVCSSDMVKEGMGTAVKIGKGKKRISVFRHNGELFALDDKCAHGKGKLSDGDVEDLGACAMGTNVDGSSVGGPCVRCPRHRSKFCGGLFFNLETGRSFIKGRSIHYTEAFHVSAYHVTEKDGKVYVASTPLHQGVTKWEKVKLLKHKATRNVMGKLCANPTPTHVDGEESVRLRYEYNEDSESTSPSTHNTAVDVGPSSNRGATASSSSSPTDEPFDQWTVIRQLTWVNHDSCEIHLEMAGDNKNSKNSDKKGDKRRHSSIARDEAFNPPLWHVTIVNNGVCRDYTPVSSLEEAIEGRLVLLVKVYEKGVISKWLGNLSKGDAVMVSRVKPTLGRSERKKLLSLQQQRGDGSTREWLFLSSGGTGITPIVQAARWARDSKVKTVVVCSNHTEEDILMKDQLGMLTGADVAVFHTLTREKRHKLHHIGRVRKDMLQDMFALASKHINKGTPLDLSSATLLTSGPEPMMDTVERLAISLGLEADSCVQLEA